MDEFLRAVWLNKPYTISYEGDQHTVVIPSDVLQFCAKPDMFVLDFLYRSYKKELSGVVLNVEQDLNPQLQVSTFFGALHNALKCKFVSLVICPDDAVIKWHYYMTWCGIFEIKIITSETAPEEINDDTGMILLLSFSNIKLVDSLRECNFFSVIIDRFDDIATKMIIRKLQGSFNIGITYRNFYIQPDQKIQWTMLNWANPGCVGKLTDFYEVDNDNFAHFRDNYKEWWFRITWNYCDSFIRPTLEEKGNLNKTLREWAKEHNLFKYSLKQSEGRRKRKVETKNEAPGNKEDDMPKRAKKVFNKTTRKNNLIKNSFSIYKESKNKIKIPNSHQEASESGDSNDTIIYDRNSHSDLVNETMQDAEDDPPIGVKTKQVEPEKPQLNICDNVEGNMSSRDQLLFSLLNDESNKIMQDAEDDPPISVKTKQVEPEKPQLNICDNVEGRMSSGDQLLFSLVNDESKTIQRKIKNHTNDSQQTDIMEIFDDESDMFLKSVAAKDDIYTNRIEEPEQSISNILIDGDSKTKTITQIDLKLSEQRILGIDIAAESDKFLKEICKEKCKEEDEISGIENNNYACTNNSTTEVDTLIAEAMKMVK